MRTQKSFKNILVGCLSYGVMMLGVFLINALFTKFLGPEMLGIENTFSHILSALAIVEMGLGFGIAYKLYKPIAEKNWDQIAIILCFLRKAYVGISIIILSLGIGISFFVGIPIQENYSKVWLSKLFLLCVMDVLATYLYAHKRSMLVADNSNYLNNTIHIFAQISMYILQAFVLIFFKSFELYIICKIVCRAAENFVVSYMFNKKYKLINLKTKEKLPVIERKDLFKNIKALLFHKITAFSISGSLSIIIYSFVSSYENGIYAIYGKITMALTCITNEVFNGVLASFANLLNSESKEKAYKNFNIIYFVNFLLYSFISASFFNIISSFVKIWPSNKILIPFDLTTTIFITAYLYMYGMKQAVSAVKAGMGINDQDKYLAVFGAALSIVTSIVLARPFGITGVMLGSIIGMIAVPYWTQPKLVYEIIFKKKSGIYHRKFALYTALTVIYTIITYFICSKIVLSNEILQIVANTLICVIVPNSLNVLIFFKTEEFKSLLLTVKSLLRKIRT